MACLLQWLLGSSEGLGALAEALTSRPWLTMVPHAIGVASLGLVHDSADGSTKPLITPYAVWINNPNPFCGLSNFRKPFKAHLSGVSHADVHSEVYHDLKPRSYTVGALVILPPAVSFVCVAAHKGPS